MEPATTINHQQHPQQQTSQEEKHSKQNNSTTNKPPATATGNPVDGAISKSKSSWLGKDQDWDTVFWQVLISLVDIIVRSLLVWVCLNLGPLGLFFDDKSKKFSFLNALSLVIMVEVLF
jgi:hypothetical protein